MPRCSETICSKSLCKSTLHSTEAEASFRALMPNLCLALVSSERTAGQTGGMLALLDYDVLITRKLFMKRRIATAPQQRPIKRTPPGRGRR